jgi:hypothetical protein
MSSVLRTTKEATSLRRQFTVYPYYTGGENNFFTVSNGTLYRFQYDLSGVDYVVARDMGTEMTITGVDSAIVGSIVPSGSLEVVRKGTARKFQVLSVISGVDNFDGLEINPTGNMYTTNADLSGVQNIVGNGTAYLDTLHATNLVDLSGINLTINDALVLGSAETTNPSATGQTLPFGTFWAVNDPIIIKYEYSFGYTQRAIKNRIDETTLF